MAAVQFDLNAAPLSAAPSSAQHPSSDTTPAHTDAAAPTCIARPLPITTFTVTLQLQIRPLDASDFHKNFFPLLEQLSNVGHISQDFFAEQLKQLHADSMKRMLVCEDVALGRIVATGTMVVEPKFIHSIGYVGHLEDLVVDHALRAKGLGQRLVQELKEFARAKSCYKVIVDCSERNASFYQKCGFKRKEMSMACYFAARPPSAAATTVSNPGLPSTTPASCAPAPASALPSLSASVSAEAATPLSVAPEQTPSSWPARRSSFSEASLQGPEDEDHVLARLGRLKLQPPREEDGLITRALQSGDYDRGFLPLLGQLTTVGDISRASFEQRVAEVLRDPFQHIVVIEDPAKGVVAAGTLLLERKFIHAGGLAGHVEDVVVDETIRGKGLGKRIVETLRNLAQDAGCYKVVLDCSEKNRAFYEKCGFRINHSPVCMACYF